MDALVPVTAALTAVSLLLPWSRSGDNDRSSIELLRTAGVLDVVSTSTRWLLVSAWFLVIVLAAGSILAAGWHRLHLAAIAAVPLAPAVVVAVVVVLRSPLPVRWGAIVGCAAGLTATARSSVILIRDGFLAEGRAV